MLEVYEIVSLGSSLLVKTSACIAVISFFAMSVFAIAIGTKGRTEKAEKIIGSILSFIIISFVLSFIILLFSIIYLDSSDYAGSKLSKDQYKLSVINNQIIQPASDNQLMKIERKKFDVLKIITETNESYIVEGDSNDNSLHKTLELKKSDYNIERK